MIAAYASALQEMGEMVAELERTILAGWPSTLGDPTADEAVCIEAIYRTLRMQDPALGEERSWIAAGVAVAQCRSDLARVRGVDQ